MHSSILALAGSCAMLVNAQAAAPAAVETLTPFQAAQAACLKQCGLEEDCKDQCIRMHNPSTDTILAMQSCQAGCVQGDGSIEQTSRYQFCMFRCTHPMVNSYVGPVDPNDPMLAHSSAFDSSSSAAPVAATDTAAAAATTPAVVVPSPVVGTATGSSSSSSKTSSFVSSTASSKPSTVETSDAADIVRFGMGGLGLAGLVVAFFM